MASLEPFIHRKIVVLHQDAPIEQAARAMCERAIGCVVVSDHRGHVAGMVTDRDLACSVLSEGAPAGMPLARIMTAPAIFVQPGDELEKAVHLMERYGIRRIPVVEILPGHPRERHRCVGIVTLDDLIASRSVSEFHLIRIVRSQLRRRIRQGRQRLGVLHVAKEGEEPARPAPEFSSAKGFFREIERRSGLEKAGWPPERSWSAIRLVLEALVRRLHHTGAIHFLTLLPDSLEEELFELPAGPDRSITAERILVDLENQFTLDRKSSSSVLIGILNSLEEILNGEQLGHVKAQLPEDIRELFRQKTAA